MARSWSHTVRESNRCTAAGTFLRHGRALAPLVALTGTRSVFRSASALLLWLPLSVTALAGTDLGYWISRPIVAYGGFDLLTWELMAALAGAILLIGVLMWWASSTAIREAMRWRSGKGS